MIFIQALMGFVIVSIAYVFITMLLAIYILCGKLKKGIGNIKRIEITIENDKKMAGAAFALMVILLKIFEI